jgi:hypothetical protein
MLIDGGFGSGGGLGPFRFLLHQRDTLLAHRARIIIAWGVLIIGELQAGVPSLECTYTFGKWDFVSGHFRSVAIQRDCLTDAVLSRATTSLVTGSRHNEG